MKRLLRKVRAWRVRQSRESLQRLRQPKDYAPPASGSRQLLLDVSVIQAHDAGTGIQRVTRGLVSALMESPPAGFSVHLVVATARSGYRYLSVDEATFLSGCPRGFSSNGPVGPIRGETGDIFLGVDFSAHILPRHTRQLRGFKEKGGRIVVVLHDLLPAQHPEWFTNSGAGHYRRWLEAAIAYADTFACVSSTVASELDHWLSSQYGFVRGEGFPAICSFRPGFELPILDSESLAGVQAFGQALGLSGEHPVILMVGTVEPRKGHALALDAFERLWAAGSRVHLCIVGKEGWKTKALARRLRSHPQSGKYLHWFNKLDDHMLANIYALADGMLMASNGEGFGLPLIEAAHFKLPILARDLPVFREVVGDNAKYFSANTGGELAIVLREWLCELQSGLATEPKEVALPSWSESATALFARIL